VIDLDDYSRKYFILHGDSLYEREMANVGDEFKADLANLGTKADTPRERQAIKQLSLSWDEFWLLYGSEKSLIKPSTDGETGDLPESLQNALDKIRERRGGVFSAGRLGIA